MKKCLLVLSIFTIFIFCSCNNASQENITPSINNNSQNNSENYASSSSIESSNENNESISSSSDEEIYDDGIDDWGTWHT